MQQTLSIIPVLGQAQTAGGTDCVRGENGMTAKEWLRRGWKIDQEINSLLRTKRETRDRLTSITAGYDGDPVQGTRDPHKYDRLVELDSKIDERVDQLVQIKAEITDAIAQVQDSRYRTLLTERYMEFKTWEQIAVDMDYSRQHIDRLHGQALKEFAAAMPEKMR